MREEGRVREEGKVTRSEPGWTLLRWLYGLFFVATGAWILVSVTTGLTSAPEQPNARSQAFMDALAATGFMDPLVAASFILGGGALLVRRTIGVGVVVLAPPVAVILLFHLTLSGQIVPGIAVAAILAAIAWKHRGGLKCLWSYDVEKRGQ